MIMPVRAGGALAATAAVGYTLCTLVFLLWPETAVWTFWLGALFGRLFERLGRASKLTLWSAH